MTYQPFSARVRNLSSIIRFSLRLIQLIAGLIASKTAERLTPAEKNALSALQVAIEALLALLPAPGSDDNPATAD